MKPDKETLELLLHTVNEKYNDAREAERIAEEKAQYFYEYKYKGEKWAYQSMITMLTQMIESCGKV